MIKKQGLHSDHRKIAMLWNSEFIDAPYKLGGINKDEGYDCISLIYVMLCKLGYKVKPYLNESVDITNYWTPYRPWLIPQWVRTIGPKISINQRKAGDVLLCYFRNVNQWNGVLYLGNEICGLVNGEINKVGSCPFKLLLPWIVEIRRCHK